MQPRSVRLIRSRCAVPCSVSCCFHRPIGTVGVELLYRASSQVAAVQGSAGASESVVAAAPKPKKPLPGRLRKKLAKQKHGT